MDRCFLFLILVRSKAQPRADLILLVFCLRLQNQPILLPNIYGLRVAGPAADRTHVCVQILETTFESGTQAGQLVALKCPNNSKARANLAREMWVHEKLGDHPNIMPLLDVVVSGEDKRTEALVLPRCECSLQQLANNFRANHPGKPPFRKLSIVVGTLDQVVKALLHMWEHGLVHHDLKPDNILVRSKGVKIMLGDFGSCHRAGGKLCGYYGTWGYMATEIMKSAFNRTTFISHYSQDVYSAGVLGRSLMTEKPLSEQPHGIVDFDYMSKIDQHDSLATYWQEKNRSYTDLALLARDVGAHRKEEATAHLVPVLFSLLQECLQPDPAARPTLEDLSKRLGVCVLCVVYDWCVCTW